MRVEILDENYKTQSLSSVQLELLAENKLHNLIKERKDFRENKTLFGNFIKACVQIVRHISNTSTGKVLNILGISSSYTDLLLLNAIGVDVVTNPLMNFQFLPSSAFISHNDEKKSGIFELLDSLEIVTLGLIHSTTEDAEGLSIQYLASVLYALLGLELALNEYSDTLRSIFAMKKYQHVYVQQKRLNGSYLSNDIQALAAAVDNSLNQLVNHFYFVITDYSFTESYMEFLRPRLATVRKN